MTFLENVLAGLVVAVLSWAAHRMRSRRALQRSAAYSSQKSEPSLMEKNAGTAKPAPPIGSHGALVELLRRLHRESCLSQRDVGEQADLSAATVNKMLNGPGLASKKNTARVASVLALRAVQTRTSLGRAEHEQALIEYDRQVSDLYDKAVAEADGPHPVETAARELWTELTCSAVRSEFCERLPGDVWAALICSELDAVAFEASTRTVFLMVSPASSYFYWDLEDPQPWGEPSWKMDFANELSRRAGVVVMNSIWLLSSARYDDEPEIDS